MCYSDTNRKDDFEWFLKEYDNLYKKYGHKFIAIKNRKIIGIFDDKNIALDTTSEKYKLGTFIVQECNGNESGYTNYITSWELVK